MSIRNPLGTQPAAGHEFATLGGGCFWCLEAVYDQMEGVQSVESGYMGGKNPNPTYKEVCGGRTGHVEVVQVTFDPAITTFREILEVFFTIHDPTTRDREFCDTGHQYRTAIFFHDHEQQIEAKESEAALDESKPFKEPIVTEIVQATKFYPAEDYHQFYYKKNPIRYKFYRYHCGRDQRLRELWGASSGGH